MKYYEMELNNEVIKLRLSSNSICEIEDKTQKSIVDLIQSVSQNTIIMFLMHLRRFEIPNYSKKDANDLYDRFIDNGYSMQDILFKVIYEGLVVSGVMTKEELSQLQEVVGVKKKKRTKKIEEIIQE